MKPNRNLYTFDFLKSCSDYMKEGHNLKETSLKFNINYGTLKINLTKYGLRTPNRKIKDFNKKSIDYFDIIDSHDKAYFLGLIMSDGFIYKNAYSYTLGLTLQLQDEYIVESFKNAIQNSAKLHHYKNSVSCKIQCTKADVDQLNKLNVYIGKSNLDYKIPDIKDEFFNSFVRGYFDGDGCITIKKTGYSIVSICCNSFVFLESLKAKLLSLDLFSNITIKEEKGKRKQPLYILYFYRLRDQKKFGEYIYENSDLKLIRKYEKFKQIPC